MNDILTVNGLNKSYGDFSLKDVTFSLPEGCITGFIGVNGAGKTTTLRTLLGIVHKLFIRLKEELSSSNLDGIHHQ